MNVTESDADGRPAAQQRRWPAYLLGGRLRTSTLVLIIAFVALWWAYDAYRPQPHPPVAPQVVPPGFIPDPAYTWVPRTRVERPREIDTPKPTPTTTHESTPETTPSSSEPPSPVPGYPFCPPLCPPAEPEPQTTASSGPPQPSTSPGPQQHPAPSGQPSPTTTSEPAPAHPGTP